MPLTFNSRVAYVYPSGAQALHANFVANDAGFYFASSGKIFAFARTGARSATNDIPLENLPTGDTVWGFDQVDDGGWAVLTRNTTGGSNIIGKVHIFNAQGRARRVFNVDAVIQGFLQERFSSPKALAYHNGQLYIRVVRSVAGNMRFLRYALDGNVDRADLTIGGTTPNTPPSSLSDADGSPADLYVVQRNERRIYAADFPNLDHVRADLQTDLDSRNTQPWACSVVGETVFVADRGGFIYSYGGVREVRRPVAFSFVNMLITNAFMAQNMNRDEERRE